MTLHVPPGSPETEEAGAGKPSFRIFILGARSESSLPAHVWEQLSLLFPSVSIQLHLSDHRCHCQSHWLISRVSMGNHLHKVRLNQMVPKRRHQRKRKLRVKLRICPLPRRKTKNLMFQTSISHQLRHLSLCSRIHVRLSMYTALHRTQFRMHTSCRSLVSKRHTALFTSNSLRLSTHTPIASSCSLPGLDSHHRRAQ